MYIFEIISRVGNVAEAINDAIIHDTTVDFAKSLVFFLDEELVVHSFEDVECSDSCSSVSEESDDCCQMTLVSISQPPHGIKK